MCLAGLLCSCIRKTGWCDCAVSAREHGAASWWPCLRLAPLQPGPYTSVGLQSDDQQECLRDTDYVSQCRGLAPGNHFALALQSKLSPPGSWRIARNLEDCAQGGSEHVSISLTCDTSKVMVQPAAANAGGSIAQVRQLRAMGMKTQRASIAQFNQSSWNEWKSMNETCFFALQVAVKTPAGVFYFTDTIPLAAVTVPCEMAQQDWLSQWKQIQVSRRLPLGCG